MQLKEKGRRNKNIDPKLFWSYVHFNCHPVEDSQKHFMAYNLKNVISMPSKILWFHIERKNMFGLSFKEVG